MRGDRCASSRSGRSPPPASPPRTRGWPGSDRSGRARGRTARGPSPSGWRWCSRGRSDAGPARRRSARSPHDPPRTYPTRRRGNRRRTSASPSPRLPAGRTRSGPICPELEPGARVQFPKLLPAPPDGRTGQDLHPTGLLVEAEQHLTEVRHDRLDGRADVPRMGIVQPASRSDLLAKARIGVRWM